MIKTYTKEDIENLGLTISVSWGDLIIEAIDGTWMRYKQNSMIDYETNVNCGICEFLTQLRKEKLTQLMQIKKIKGD